MICFHKQQTWKHLCVCEENKARLVGSEYIKIQIRQGCTEAQTQRIHCHKDAQHHCAYGVVPHNRDVHNRCGDHQGQHGHYKGHGDHHEVSRDFWEKSLDHLDDDIGTEHQTAQEHHCNGCVLDNGYDQSFYIHFSSPLI